jgi:hypothetical protein
MRQTENPPQTLQISAYVVLFYPSLWVASQISRFVSVARDMRASITTGVRCRCSRCDTTVYGDPEYCPNCHYSATEVVYRAD